MMKRWFDPIAAALVAAALLAMPVSSTEVSAKMKGTTPAKTEPKVNALTAPPPTVVGGIDTRPGTP